LRLLRPAQRVILEVRPDQQGDLATLDKLYVRGKDGTAVPLSTFVTADTRAIANGCFGP